MTAIESGALVPVDNMAAVEELDPQAREVAVTQMLTEARAWLAHAVESTGPQTIANFKAQMATVAEATKQLNLSKEIQLDALEMVRRAERGVGLAIRKGQAEGTIETETEARVRAGAIRQQSVENILVKTRPADIASQDDLRGNGAGILHLADGVTDEQFDSALTEAKDEGNLSRANVVRKVRNIKDGTVETRDQRAKKIAELAASGHSTRQIAPLVGIGESAVANIVRDYGIHVPADALVKRTRRIRTPEVIENVIGTLDAATFSLGLINPSEVQGEQIDSLIQSISALRRAIHKIKESNS